MEIHYSLDNRTFLRMEMKGKERGEETRLYHKCESSPILSLHSFP